VYTEINCGSLKRWEMLVPYISGTIILLRTLLHGGSWLCSLYVHVNLKDLSHNVCVTCSITASAILQTSGLLIRRFLYIIFRVT
jgi:hypothetical protein